MKRESSARRGELLPTVRIDAAAQRNDTARADVAHVDAVHVDVVRAECSIVKLRADAFVCGDQRPSPNLRTSVAAQRTDAAHVDGAHVDAKRCGVLDARTRKVRVVGCGRRKLRRGSRDLI